MSVTFSAQTPMMAKAQFGQQKQARANNAQLGNLNPSDDTSRLNNRAGAAPKFGFAICSTLCCIGAAPIAIIGSVIGLIVWGIRKAIK